MKIYEVWMEGYNCTGNYCPDEYMGTYTAHSFKEACMKALKAKKCPEEEIKQYYDKETNSFWGCRFYDHNPHHFQ